MASTHYFWNAHRILSRPTCSTSQNYWNIFLSARVDCISANTHLYFLVSKVCFLSFQNHPSHNKWIRTCDDMG